VAATGGERLASARRLAAEPSRGAFARVLPYLVSNRSHVAPGPRRRAAPNACLLLDTDMPELPTTPGKPDPNAELRGFEPLRVALAIGALLLGLLAGIH
jgi:hypothetical protein